MPSFVIQWSEHALADLGRLDAGIARSVVIAVDRLAEQPRPAGCRKLTGRPGWRIVVRKDYRVIYDIEDGRLVVLVLHVAHRREVYR